MNNFIDFRQSKIKDFDKFDICIIGAGAAGITLARELSKQKVKVLLLESGGLDIHGDTQSLYHAEQDGLPYYDLSACRLRFLGGTTNHWSGFCRENEPIDYEGRSELNVPAWPVQYNDIRPYVLKAAERLGFPVNDWDPKTQAKHYYIPENQLVESNSSIFDTKVFLVTKKRRFREIYVEDLNTQDNLTVLTYANAIHLKLRANSKEITSIVIKSLDGNVALIHAKKFVLATHAIENARLLLVSNDVQKNGIGNNSGQVGKNFMEHPFVASGAFVPTESFPPIYCNGYVPKENKALETVNSNLSLSREAMTKSGVLQYYCRFNPVYPTDETMTSFGTLKDSFWKPADIQAITALNTIFGDIPESSRFLFNKFKSSRFQPIAYKLEHRIEQIPNAESNIKLDTSLDALGMRKVRLNWSLHDVDYKTFKVGQEYVASELKRLGWGQYKGPALTKDLIDTNVQGHYHHIGTTRMSDSAKEGVVDKNCKVHGIDNLYIAGSSIFPTSGYSGPTMMIVAFSIRLADHLKSLIVKI